MADGETERKTALGLLLVQLGTPDAPTAVAVRRYLGEFLSDRRVVDLNPWLWRPLLHGVILPRRAPRSAALYRKIWRDDGVSPLLHHTRTLTGAVAGRLGPGVLTRFAMRYGNPSLTRVIGGMLDQGVRKLLVLPLYPQFSASTGGSALDGVQAALAGRGPVSKRFVPDLRFVGDFHDDPGYIDALARSVPRDGGEDFFLFSFHGLPQRHVDEGDPYAGQCAATARLLADALGLPESGWRLSFQSRFGREPWLLPATDDTLRQLPGEGVRRLAVVCPGFAADCLETLEEMAIQGRRIFLEAGGESFRYVPCLNDDPVWIEALTALARRQLSGWLQADDPAAAVQPAASFGTHPSP